jgi:starch synthase
MQGILTARQEQLFGIVNGIDTTTWDPATDPFLPAHYSAEAIEPGKSTCKYALQERFGLPIQPDTPVLGVVARLAEQKGIDLIASAAQHFLRQDVQLIVLGNGQPRYQQILQELHTQFPTKVGLLLGFDEPLAHLIEAGSDLFLMPSLYEPSGLNQLYSLRYGTPPVVRATGGLADTIVDATAKNLEDGTATGFCFGPYEVVPFLEAIQRAIDLYQTRSKSAAWNNLLACAMRQVWSWDRSAEQYEAVYQGIRKG